MLVALVLMMMMMMVVVFDKGLMQEGDEGVDVGCGAHGS